MKAPPAYILAGGESRRFGRDKARVEVDGLSLIRHVAEGVAPAVSSVTVVARTKDEYAALGFRTIGDRHRGRGPLGGLDAALADRDRDGWIVVTSCDLLGLRPEWIRLLIGSCSDDVQVAVFRGERWMPFPGLYHTSCKGEVEERLRRGEGAIWRLIEAVPHASVPLPPDWERVVHINRPSDIP